MAVKSARAEVSGLGHVNIRAPAPLIERLHTFYRDVVGLTEGDRPAFRSGSHGYWMYAGNRDAIHLTVDPAADTGGTTHTGAFNHLAFDCRGLADTLARLRRAGIGFDIDHVDELGQVQLFLTDPAGLGIELTFTGEVLPG